MWLWEENIPFEGHFKITRQVGGTGQLCGFWIAEIGFKQLREYLFKRGLLWLDKQHFLFSCKCNIPKTIPAFHESHSQVTQKGFHSMSRKGISNCKPLLFRAHTLGVAASSSPNTKTGKLYTLFSNYRLKYIYKQLLLHLSVFKINIKTTPDLKVNGTWRTWINITEMSTGAVLKWGLSEWMAYRRLYYRLPI